MRIAILWASNSRGMYATKSFDELYKLIGHNNGNLAFVYAVEQHLAGEVSHFPWHTQAATLNAQADMVVLPAANQLGKHTDLGQMGAMIEGLEIPMVAIGLGAQADDTSKDVELSEGTMRWLQALVENGRRHGIQNLYTRGPYTTEQIRRLTGAESFAGGCPSYFISPDAGLGRAIAARWDASGLPKRIAVASGHESWAKTRQAEQQLVALMMDPLYPGIFIPQSMGDMIRISRDGFDDIDPAQLDRIRAHVLPHYSVEEFKLWARTYAHTFYDVPAWADMLRRHDLVIGPRYHGCAIAVQAGMMGYTLTIDSRTEEMCRETGVPFMPVGAIDKPLTRRTIRDMIVFDGDAYDAERSARAARYVGFLKAAGIPYAPYLDRL